MKQSENGRLGFLENLSTWVIVSWVGVIGVGGFVLLCLIAYAMTTDNLALGVVCGLLLFSPYILGVIWFLSMGSSLWAERVSTKAKETSKVTVQS